MAAALSAQVVPTILAGTAVQFQQYINAYQGFAKRVQIDITDGQFAPTTTVQLQEITWPETWTVDLHMMVVRPSEHLEMIKRLKPSLCIFHAETGENLLPIFTELHNSDIKCGVALMKSTYPGDAKAFIEAADHVLIFAGDLGRQGGSADFIQVEKVSIIKNIKSDVEIGWDGGANLKNVRALSRAGVNVINVGSAIASAPNPAEAFQELRADIEKKGVAL